MDGWSVVDRPASCVVEQLVVESRIESLRRFKDDVREVASSFECGIGLAGSPEFAEGDVIECFQMVSEGSA